MGDDGLNRMGEVIQILLNHVMKCERDKYLQAEPYQRSEERIDYANGYKAKRLNTRLGKLLLDIPQVRHGAFYPSALERGMRSEKALKISIAEMYLQGVSTRKITSVMEELCGFEVSSTQVSEATKQLDPALKAWRERPLGCFRHVIVDALYEKIREGGRVISSAILIGYGIDDDGKRHVLGISIATSEAEIHWRNFFQSLVQRGLHGIETITSDAHAGLQLAICTVFSGVQWQRCQFHLQQNAMSYVPRLDMRVLVAEQIRQIFNASRRSEADRLLQEAIAEWTKKAPKLAAWAEENIPQGLAVMSWDKRKQKKLRTSNLAERVNKEIRRRTRVVGIFPNAEACLRLITAFLMETDEDWSVEKSRYLAASENVPDGTE
jgi:transposase-like protein